MNKYLNSTKDAFVNIEFEKSVFKFEDLSLAKDLREFCFIGRSNVGKSSFINLITNRNSLAKTSKAAGCTKSLNFFNIADSFYMVDLPGYGFAKKSKKEIENWNILITTYLQYSKNLRRIYLLIDARHFIKDNDVRILELLGDLAINTQFVITKADKVKKKEIDKIANDSKEFFKKYPFLDSEIIYSSSLSKRGCKEFLLNFQKFFGAEDE